LRDGVRVEHPQGGVNVGQIGASLSRALLQIGDDAADLAPLCDRGVYDWGLRHAGKMAYWGSGSIGGVLRLRHNTAPVRSAVTAARPLHSAVRTALPPLLREM
jgi:hypothetical protein